VFDRPEVAALSTGLTDPVDVIPVACDFVADAMPRSARLLLAYYHAASTDPAIAQAFDALATRGRNDTLRLVTVIAELGGLRPDVPPRQLADEIHVLFLPTNYEQLTGNAGWSLDTYRGYLFTHAVRILLGPEHTDTPTAHAERHERR
jgi:hypothetical protein